MFATYQPKTISLTWSSSETRAQWTDTGEAWWKRHQTKTESERQLHEKKTGTSKSFSVKTLVEKLCSESACNRIPLIMRMLTISVEKLVMWFDHPLPRNRTLVLCTAVVIKAWALFLNRMIWYCFFIANLSYFVVIVFFFDLYLIINLGQTFLIRAVSW